LGVICDESSKGKPVRFHLDAISKAIRPDDCAESLDSKFYILYTIKIAGPMVQVEGTSVAKPSYSRAHDDWTINIELGPDLATSDDDAYVRSTILTLLIQGADMLIHKMLGHDGGREVPEPLLAFREKLMTICQTTAVPGAPTCQNLT
jgi:hypothetical protein